MTRTTLTVLAALLALSACNGSDDESGAVVERTAVPDNACELVPSELISDWELAEVDHSTSTRESLSFGRCTMAGSADDVALDLSLTNYSGGDADSADGFAAGERADSCADLSATEAPKGTFGETESSCTASSTSGDTASVVLISDVLETHGVVRIEMSAPAREADRVEAAVNDVLAAVKASAL